LTFSVEIPISLSQKILKFRQNILLQKSMEFMIILILQLALQKSIFD